MWYNYHMEEIIFHIKNRTIARRLAGFSMIILGLLLHLIPLMPGSWAIIIGLEVLGIRLLVQDKFREWAKNSKYCKRWCK